MCSRPSRLTLGPHGSTAWNELSRECPEVCDGISATWLSGNAQGCIHGKEKRGIGFKSRLVHSYPTIQTIAPATFGMAVDELIQNHKRRHAHTSKNYRCRVCGDFASIKSETEHIVRIECQEHGTQTLWGDEL